MKGFILNLLILSILLSVSAALKNVLFLAVDDLRPEINAYKNTDPSFNKNILTPNLDKLAAESLVLKNAFVQETVCSPSRTSLLTGRRPDTTHVYDLFTYWRDVSGNFTTIPQYFKENGYETGGIGKIYHAGAPSGYEDPPSWTLKYFKAKRNFEDKENSWKAVDDELLKTDKLRDEQIADRAKETLQNLSAAALSGDKPFFLAVGFYKPHLPFVAPASYFKKYRMRDIEVPDNLYVPENGEPVSWRSYSELRDYKDMSSYSGDWNTTLPKKAIKELRRAYYASITWVDDLIGGVLDKLEDLGLADNTIVSFWGDHGWHLGEHAEWCKSTMFDLATRAPMMIKVPGETDAGVDTEELTEFVDLFPTLVEAAGLPTVSQCGDNSVETILCTEGVSLLPLITKPNTALKTAAFTQFPRNKNTKMGYTIRTKEYRYTEWIKFDSTTYKPNWDDPKITRELFDLVNDPQENHNVAKIVDNRVVAILSSQLRAGWRSAIVK